MNMLLKRIIIKRGFIDNFEEGKIKVKDVVFRRVRKIHKHKAWCIWDDNKNDLRCKYQNFCTLRYTCQYINMKRDLFHSIYIYIPATVCEV